MLDPWGSALAQEPDANAQSADDPTTGAEAMVAIPTPSDAAPEISMGEIFSMLAVVLVLAVIISFGVAVVIRVITVALGVIKTSAPSTPAGQPVAAAPTSTAPPPEHVAAIAAAVTAIVGAHRIVHIEPRDTMRGWVAAGRSEQQGSHLPRGG